jgi:hypothetical protein
MSNVPTTKSFVVGLLLCLAAAAPCSAQVTIDATTLTCRNFLTETVTAPDKISYWLSGYYNGKRANTSLNVTALLAFIDNMRDYCLHNQDVTVMKAAETLLGVK